MINLSLIYNELEQEEVKKNTKDVYNALKRTIYQPLFAIDQ